MLGQKHTHTADGLTTNYHCTYCSDPKGETFYGNLWLILNGSNQNILPPPRSVARVDAD